MFNRYKKVTSIMIFLAMIFIYLMVNYEKTFAEEENFKIFTPQGLYYFSSCNGIAIDSSVTVDNGKIMLGMFGMFGMYGDVNGDGYITSSDTNLINKYVSGKASTLNTLFGY